MSERSKTALELLAQELVGWDQKQASVPILNVARALVDDGRFDDTTDVLNVWLVAMNSPQLTLYVIGKIPPLVFNYSLKQPGIDEQVAMDLWSAEGVYKSVKSSALVSGKLKLVVQAFVSKISGMSDKAGSCGFTEDDFLSQQPNV